MYKALNYLSLIIGAVLLVLGLIPLNSLLVSGNLGCSDALGFSYSLAGLVLLVAVTLIDKKYPSSRNVIFAFIFAFLVLYVSVFVIQRTYGMPVGCHGFGPY